MADDRDERDVMVSVGRDQLAKARNAAAELGLEASSDERLVELSLLGLVNEAERRYIANLPTQVGDDDESIRIAVEAVREGRDQTRTGDLP